MKNETTLDKIEEIVKLKERGLITCEEAYVKMLIVAVQLANK